MVKLTVSVVATANRLYVSLTVRAMIIVLTDAHVTRINVNLYV